MKRHSNIIIINTSFKYHLMMMTLAIMKTRTVENIDAMTIESDGWKKITKKRIKNRKKIKEKTSKIYTFALAALTIKTTSTNKIISFNFKGFWMLNNYELCLVYYFTKHLAGYQVITRVDKTNNITYNYCWCSRW